MRGFRWPIDVHLHASAVVWEAVAVAEHDESSVAETFPVPLKLGTVGPEELKDLSWMSAMGAGGG